MSVFIRFFKGIFTIAILTVAFSFIAKLLENVFSKDDGVLHRDSMKVLSNSEDKKIIFDAINQSRKKGGQVQSVKLTSTNEILEISA